MKTQKVKKTKKTAKEPMAAVGRPSKYGSIDLGQITKLAELGLTDKQIAYAVGVCEDTIYEYKKKPEFSEALKKGKEVSDEKVVRSLYERATGYNYNSEKIMTVSDGNNCGSHVERLPIVEHCPPDVTACIFWLKNRRPEDWREKVEVGGKNGDSIKLDVTVKKSREELMEEAAARGLPTTIFK